MLKHMLNGNASAASGEQSGAAQPSAQSPPRSAPAASPLQRRQPSEEDALSAGRLRRGLVEPEYQNTRRRSSPSADFGRKSVRNVESVAAVAEPGLRRPDPAWMGSSTRARTWAPSYDANGSVGATFSFVAAQQQQLQQHQQLQPFHSPNHGDAVCNLSTITAPCPVFTPIANGPTKAMANGGLHIAKQSPIGSATSTNVANCSVRIPQVCAAPLQHAAAASDSSADTAAKEETEEGGAYDDCGPDGSFGDGVKEMLTSLGLLCLVSLLLALLSLIFLLKISPLTAADLKEAMRADQLTIISPDEYVTVYEVTLALCSLTLSLNLCCLLVCSVQFLFAVKLTRSSFNGERTNNYLQKSAVTRVCAIAGFFISIPVFLTGVILYTFVQFHSTAAIITSVLVGSGIVFCGCAMVHNVFVWQKEKTNAVKELVRRQRTLGQRPQPRRQRRRGAAGRRPEDGKQPDAVRSADQTSAASPSLAVGQAAALDGNISRASHELSTLV